MLSPPSRRGIRVWALVSLGSGAADQNLLSKVAHHLILDRVYFHGDPHRNCFRCERR